MRFIACWGPQLFKQRLQVCFKKFGVGDLPANDAADVRPFTLYSFVSRDVISDASTAECVQSIEENKWVRMASGASKYGLNC